MEYGATHKPDVDQWVYASTEEFWAECPDRACPDRWRSLKYIEKGPARSDLLDHLDVVGCKIP